MTNSIHNNNSIIVDCCFEVDLVERCQFLHKLDCISSQMMSSQLTLYAHYIMMIISEWRASVDHCLHFPTHSIQLTPILCFNVFDSLVFEFAECGLFCQQLLAAECLYSQFLPHCLHPCHIILPLLLMALCPEILYV